MKTSLHRRKKENYGYQKWVYFTFKETYIPGFPKAPWLKFPGPCYFVSQRIGHNNWKPIYLKNGEY